MENTGNKKIQLNYKNLGIIVAFVIFCSVVLFSFLLYEGGRSDTNQTVEPVATPMEVDELKIKDIVVGNGKEAKNGSKVTVNYVGTLTDGTQFDSSYDRGEPYSFTLGEGSVIPGWDQGLIGMKEGGKRRLTIPPDLAYGASGTGSIPPNSTLIFEIELLQVE